MKKDPATDTEMNTGWGLKTFSRDALDKIHTAMLDGLRSTGPKVDCDKALDVLEKGGCRVNKKTQVVRFPDHIVMQALSTCPSKVLLAGRNAGNDFLMGGRQIGFTTFWNRSVDRRSGNRRNSRVHQRRCGQDSTSDGWLVTYGCPVIAGGST